MNKIVYHGSSNGNIKKLEKRLSTHRKECVYATDNEAIALLFASHGLGDLDTLIGYDEGIPFVVERRKGILKQIYDKEGYIYELDGKNFNHYDYLWEPEVISFEEEEILSCKKVENILEALKEKESEKSIVIYEYPDRPKDVPLDNSDLIEKYTRFEKNGINGAVQQMLEVYPEFQDRINDESMHM